MFNIEELNANLTKAVKDAVNAEAHKLTGGMAVNDLIAPILNKPFMSFPDDVQLILKMGRTTTFDLPKDGDFPPLNEVGNKRFVNTEKFMGFLAAKERAA